MALNYHHLRYFRAVATEGHLGRAAAKMNLSQSALSIQIKQLEDRIGHPLFDRVGRSLVLTEAGRIALGFADRIFEAGDELVATLSRHGVAAPPLRIGAVSTLSRNFQLQVLRPLLAEGTYRIDLKSGGLSGLVEDLEAQRLDLVLSTEVPARGGDIPFTARKLAEQPVGLHGRPDLLTGRSLANLLATAPLILPTETVIRAQFDDLCTRLGAQPRIAANVDDMAMIRLLTREGAGVAFAPAVVLADEIASGAVATAPYALDIAEPFFAITVLRAFPHPAMSDLLDLADATPNKTPPQA